MCRAFLIFALLLPSLASAATITVNGSTSMSDLNRRLTSEFSAASPATKFELVITDSTKGIAALIEGKADVAASSRQIKPGESAKVERVMAVPVARDAVAVYVHPSNKVQSLSLDQLAKIFSGAIRNWNEVGGANAPIQLYSREASSGTLQFFRDEVLGKDGKIAASAKEINSAGEVITTIARDPNAIGFASFVFTRSVKALSVRRGNAAAIAPTRENVLSGAYPLSRVLYYYLGRAPQGELLKFVQWILSPSGQQSVAKAGFFPAK